MTTQTKQMSPVDSAWLHMDEPTNLMMITGVSLLDKLPDFDDLVACIAAAHDAGRVVAIHCVTRAEIVFAATALERAGAQLCFVSALEDSTLPDVHALYIGGGFPETHARELADYARPLRAHVNLIPLNPTPGYPTIGSPPDRVAAFARWVRGGGVTATASTRGNPPRHHVVVYLQPEGRR